MKAKELREKTNEELLGLLADRQKHLVEFRLQMVTGTVENVRSSRSARHDIARIKTVLREREAAAGQPNKAN
ncbi:MAG: 50S ribosomal protein L29 [Candidatus Hydrogenedens sp.]|nr:50S ribosomal protein L29 [Candidatus Hydrogenedens sp.]